MRPLIGLLLLPLLAACSSSPKTPAVAPAPGPAEACVGLPEEHRRFDPLAQVSQRRREHRAGKVIVEVPAGARIAIGAPAGVTEQWLQHVVDCRRAELAARGYPDDGGPLAVEGIDVDVSPHDSGFFLDISSPYPHAGKEVYRRAKALVR